MRKARRLILLLAIVLSLGGVGYKVTETIIANKIRAIKRNPLEALDYLPESALHIRDFHRAKIEGGRKVWEIFGDEANYYKQQKEAVVKKPRFYYYDKTGETADTLAAMRKIKDERNATATSAPPLHQGEGRGEGSNILRKL